MQIYKVGGAVRDRLLGRPVTDIDWVVVGASSDEMLARGYRPVGADFPVFLHPQSGEEYALARTERKSGRGYGGFTFHASPEVTLEEDLTRRDLTINAMAEDEQGRVIDPYGGQADLEARLLRHVSPAFAEDPLRVLRVARFAARYAGLGFRIAAETLALMRQLAESGELQALTPERSWKEISRALMEPNPEVFIQVLHDCGALAELDPGSRGAVRRTAAGGPPSGNRYRRPCPVGIAAMRPPPAAAQRTLGLPPARPGQGTHQRSGLAPPYRPRGSRRAVDRCGEPALQGAARLPGTGAPGGRVPHPRPSGAGAAP